MQDNKKSFQNKKMNSYDLQAIMQDDKKSLQQKSMDYMYKYLRTHLPLLRRKLS